MAQFEFSVQSACLKVMGKALHAMGKQTSEVHIHVNKDQMTLKGRSKDRVCYVEFVFQKAFFTTFTVPDSTEAGAPKQKALSMKYMMRVFKSLNDLDKIRLFTFSWNDDKADLLECCAEYNHSWTRTVKLPFIDERPLSGVKRFPSKDHFEIPVSEFSSSLSSFQRSEQYINWVANDQEVSLKNHNGAGHLKKTKTHTKIQRADFTSYRLDPDVPPEKRAAGITFTVANVKRFIQFGESKLLKLVCDPGEINKPLVWSLEYDNDCLSACLITSSVITSSADDSTSVLRNNTVASRRSVAANQTVAQTPTSSAPPDSFLTHPHPRVDPPRPNPSTAISQFSAVGAPPVPSACTTPSLARQEHLPPSPPQSSPDLAPRTKRIRFTVPETHTTDSPEPRNRLFRQLQLYRNSRKAAKSSSVTERVFTNRPQIAGGLDSESQVSEFRLVE